MLLTVGIGLFYKAPHLKLSNNDHSVLVFFPMYKPTRMAVLNLRKQKAELETKGYKLFVLSQEGSISIDNELSDVADYFRSKKFSHLKGNSYHHALQFAVNEIQFFDGKIDSILLMDSDNYMSINSLNRLVESRIKGSSVAISRRLSYSNNNSTSLFDDMSERLNDYMFRRSKSMLGFYPELSGSGMLMDTNLFKNAVNKLDRISPGMDKQLLIRMMFEENDLRISYNEKAIILDEKTEDSKLFKRQRKRWFGNQYYCAYKFGWKLLSSRKSSLVDYGISLCRPPRSLQIVGTVFLVPLDLFAYSLNLINAPIISFSALGCFVAIGLFLLNEGMFKKVISNIIPLVWTSLKNGYIAVDGSLNSTGTFIHTRNK
jgi:cellulose synthase/poly-beta-1,6-N-acetylglucosamine synthase-like glycosyltransferase